MQLIVLGGAGDMGSRAVEDLAVSEGVARVTVADRDVAAASRLADRLRGGGAEVDAVGVDANDHASLVEALRGHDVAASALGPFFRFEEKLVRAAIEAGVDYCSICDEWGPAEAVIDRFHDEAREKGVTVITGLGASPGVTNVTVAHLARGLDRVRRAQVAVYLPLDSGGGGAALRHGLHIMTGHVAILRGGRRITVPACSEAQDVEFPRFGTVRTWNMGHSEPVTIPRYLPGIESVDFLMGFGRGSSVITRLARWGLFASDRRADAIVKVVDRLERLTAGPEPAPGAMRVDLWGVKDGEAHHRMNCGTGGMREITGLSLSVGAWMLGRKTLVTAGGGVHAPEGCLEPGCFLEQMKARGVIGYEDLEMTRPAN